MVQPFLNPSYGLQPGDALMGLVAGDGFIFANIAAHAGGGQALATPLIPAASMYNINVVATAGDSVGLPFAVPGQLNFLLNSTGTSCNIFANPTANRSNANALDIIIGAGSSNTNTTAVALAGNTVLIIFCPVLGIWATR